MTSRTVNVLGALLALLGLGISMVEFALRWWFELHREHYDLSLWPVLFGMVIIFLGGFIVNSKRASGAADTVVTAAVRIIQVLPFFGGRRATDQPNAVVVAPPPPAKPAPPADAPDPYQDKP